MTGTGTGAFCFLVPSGGSTSATVAPGQTGSYALQAEAANGFSGDVNLACTGAPSAATCALTPTTVNVGGSELAALQVHVATSGGTVANIACQPDGTHRVSKWIDRAGILVLAIIVLSFSQGGLAEILRGEPHFDRNRVRYVSLYVAALSLTFALALILGACGGSGASPGTTPDPVTPAGMYPITVTGTTNTGASQSITLSLTVQ
ncbi:MAG TPA: hypothetical protein VJR26_13460 [Candidatus Acidoferrales bacterium]|nr:hypothetical protein [Candidatus Acidoferrales bacterium]